MSFPSTNNREVTLGDVIAAIEEVAPKSLQESWDNTGWQLLTPRQGASAACAGVLTCVDVTEPIVEEAAAQGFNLIVSHHPVLFKGQKSLTGATQVERVILEAMRRGVSIYSSHTALDSAPGVGISWEIGRRIGLTDMEVLAPSAANPEAGLGVIGNLPDELTPGEFAERVKSALGIPVAVCSRPDDPRSPLGRVALCGGSGGEFLTEAIARGADAYVSSDMRHHDIVDYRGDILIVNIGHHEAERCAKDIFYHAITKKIPNFAVKSSEVERDPVVYL